MTEKDKSKVANQTKHLPKDAHAIISIMKEVGITEYEPRVVNQLLEFTHNYVTSVLKDAKLLATHAKKKIVDLEDVRLACQLQADKSFTSPPPRDILMELARTKNLSPLPLIQPQFGLSLPPERYCLSACNYRLKNPTTKKMVPKATTSATTNKTAAGVMKRPKPPLKFSTTNPTHKIVDKPEARAPPGYSPLQPANMDVDDLTMLKKKRDDHYDFME